MDAHDLDGDRSGLGCLWIIGWTLLSFYAFSFALLGFELDGYPETDATTWAFAPAEIVLLGLGLLFWLSGISVWFTARWLRQARRDDATSAHGLTGFATVWGVFLLCLALSLGFTADPLVYRTQFPHRWLWFLDTPALPIFRAATTGMLWVLGIIGWNVARTRLWRSIDGST